MINRRLFLTGTATAAVGVAAGCAAEQPGVGSPATPGAPLVALADVPVGGAVRAETAAGDPVVVAQPTQGTAVAFSAVCTHNSCLVEPDAAELACPCHGSVFDAETGEVIQGPATRALPAVAVEVRDGQVVEG